MARFIKKRKKKQGQPLDAAQSSLTPEAKEGQISCTIFNSDTYQTHLTDQYAKLIPLLDQNQNNVCWIQITGLSYANTEEAGKTLGIHSLFLEDILNTDHRPKTDELDERLFIVLKTVTSENGGDIELKSSQVSIILGKTFVVLFQEKETGLFRSIQNRIQTGKGRIRSAGADYLFYALVDAVVDSYFSITEKVGSEIEKLEAKIENRADDGTPKRINHLKNETLFLRKIVLPTKDSLNQILRNPPTDFQERNLIYMNDAYEHMVQIVDAVNYYREMLSDLHKLHLANVNQKLTEVMKVLTIFTALFIPLNFIVGFYGMNFKDMPEFTWKYGYHYVWGLLIATTVALMFYIRQKKWLK